MLGWLAIFFGRTLRAGQTPLIEQIARVSEPDMPPALCRYTRWLTAIWCAWFVFAACISVAGAGFLRISAMTWAGTLLLFIGERVLRPFLFPGRVFPGLVQQCRDTLQVWGPGRRD